MEALRRIYGYRMFPGRGPYARAFRDWLLAEAEQARSNDDLARRFIARCRETMTILPAITTIERLCADALVAAERRIEKRIAARLDPVACDGLDRLTTEMLPGRSAASSGCAGLSRATTPPRRTGCSTGSSSCAR
jgi:hypothetical protein